MSLVAAKLADATNNASATNERFKDKEGQWQDRTEWHNVVLWQRLAEIAGDRIKDLDKRAQKLTDEQELLLKQAEELTAIWRYLLGMTCATCFCPK